MIKDIITDTTKLIQPADMSYSYGTIITVADDLIDTANSHIDRCLGLASNQIGVLASVFVIRNGETFKAIIQPEVLSRKNGVKSDYETCLSLPGIRTKVRRFKTIKIRYRDINNREVIETFKGLNARIVQHEMDHLKGILI